LTKLQYYAISIIPQLKKIAMQTKTSKNKIIGYPKVIVKKSKSGKGIFALEEIKRGTKIMQYIGKKITSEQANESRTIYI